MNKYSIFPAVAITIVVLGLGVLIGWMLAMAPNSVIAPLDTNTTLLNSNADSNTDSTVDSNTNNSSDQTTNESTAINSSESSTVNTAPSESETKSVCIDAGACNADAQEFCADEWSGQSIEASWKLDLVRCLYDEHKDDVSPECLESLECRQTLNENLTAACKSDQRTFCQGVLPKPGSEPLVDCLEEHFAELSSDCAAAWTAHDAAKPR